MPNWCSNSMLVHGSAGSISDLIAKMVKDSADGGKEIDFNGVRPMPEELNGIFHGFTTIDDVQYRNWREIDGKQVGITEDEARDLYLKYGSIDWYDWCIDNWGTKWNGGELYIYSVHPDGTEVVFGFDTAWSPPEGVYDAMAECWPDLSFEGYSVEEGVGFEASFIGGNGIMVSDYRDLSREDNDEDESDDEGGYEHEVELDDEYTMEVYEGEEA